MSTIPPHEDATHPNNGVKFLSGRKCLDCDNQAGTAWSPHWCQSCNAKRINGIAEGFTKIADKFAGMKA